MAFGQFESYEPAELPGAYNFKTLDGKDMLFSGPEAEQLRARIDASNQANMFAANATGEKASKADGGGNPFNRSAEDLAGAGAKIAAQNQEALGAPAPGPEAPAAPGAQQGGPRPVMVNGINTGMIQGPDGQVYERTAGSRGVSREQLQSTAQQGVAMPTSQQDTIAGGFAPDQDFLEARRDRTIDQRMLLDRQRDQELNDSRLEQKFIQDQFVAQSNAYQEQQAQVNAIQAQVAKDQAAKDAALKEFRSSKVEPDRIFADKETGGAKRAILAIAAGLGAFAAIRTGSRNFAMDAIESAINRDIAAQEANIKLKKENADNALAELMRSGMSLDQAKITLKMVQNDWAKAQFGMARAASSSDKINMQYDAMDLKLQEQLANADEAYRQDSLGRATKTVAAAYQYPQAGSAGGYRPVTGERAVRLGERQAELDSKFASTAKTLAEASAPGVGGPVRGIESEKVTKVTALADGVDAAVNILQELGDEEGNYDDPTSGVIDQLANKDRVNKLDEQTVRLAKGAQASRGKSDKDAELAEKDVAGNGSASARRRLAQQQLKIQRDALVLELQGMTPAQRQEVLQAMPEQAKALLKGEL